MLRRPHLTRRAGLLIGPRIYDVLTTGAMLEASRFLLPPPSQRLFGFHRNTPTVAVAPPMPPSGLERMLT